MTGIREKLKYEANADLQANKHTCIHGAVNTTQTHTHRHTDTHTQTHTHRHTHTIYIHL